MASVELETCANCGRAIGKLEMPHLWNEQVVCGECINRLSPPVTTATPSTPTQSLEQLSQQLSRNHTDQPPRRNLMPGERVCPNPNCGFCGKGKREARGSGVIFVILILLWIIPGLIYWALCGGYRIVCPKCGMEWSVELR
jgi:hypothetical protein